MHSRTVNVEMEPTHFVKKHFGCGSPSQNMLVTLWTNRINDVAQCLAARCMKIISAETRFSKKSAIMFVLATTSLNDLH